MSLEEKINASLKDAMKAKDKSTLNALRSVKKEIIEAKTAKGSSGELTPEMELKLLQKMVKQRNDSAQIYKEKGREDLLQIELQEIEVLSQFLPKQLSRDEIEKVVVGIINDLGVDSMAGMGRVMGEASKQLAGKADGRIISEIVKSKLGK